MSSNAVEASSGSGAAEAEAAIRLALDRDGPELLRAIGCLLRKHSSGRPPNVIFDEAMDIWGETATRALEGAARFDPRRRAYPWLRAIASRVIAGRYRDGARERRCLGEWDDTLDVLARLAAPAGECDNAEVLAVREVPGAPGGPSTPDRRRVGDPPNRAVRGFRPSYRG